MITSIQAYKSTVIALLCICLLLAYCCWVLFGQQIWFGFIEYQCTKTRETFIDPYAEGAIAHGTDLEALALRLDFLMGYYDRNVKLVGPRLEPVVTRDYQQTLRDAVALFRSRTAIDLGSDPKAWIKKYEH